MVVKNKGKKLLISSSKAVINVDLVYCNIRDYEFF